MNFRELFSRLDGIVNEYQDPVTGAGIRGLQPKNQQTPDQEPTAKPEQPSPTQQSTIPGQQPSLGPKTTMTPQELQAAQFPNQKPAPAPATVTDPKADVNAMTQALKAIAANQQPAQPQLQPTSSAGVQQQQQSANEPKQITTPKPGEPMEEDQLEEASREEKIARWKEWYAKNPDKADQIHQSVRAEVLAQSPKFSDGEKRIPKKDADAPKKDEKPKTASNYKGSTGSQEIKKLNPGIKDVNKIYVGQEITLPDGSKYTVKKGDTLDAIARGTKPAPKPDVKPVSPKPEVDTANNTKIPVSAADREAETRATIAKIEKEKQDASDKSYLDKLRGEYTNKDSFMRKHGAHAINDKGEVVYWDQGNNMGGQGSWKAMPGYHKDTATGWYDPELVAVGKRQGLVPNDDTFTQPDDRAWYQKPFKERPGTVKLNFNPKAPVADAPAQAPATTNTKPTSNATPDFSKMSADQLTAWRANQQASGNDIPPGAINPKAPPAPKAELPVDQSKEATKEMKAIDLQSVVEQLNEWSLSDKIHPDVDYSWGDAATDVALTGAGVLATGLTGGTAAPVAAAATGARAARLANLAVKAGKNIVQGAKAAATSPSVAKDLAIKTAKSSAGAVPASAAVSTGVNKALSVDEQAQTELQRITNLIKKV